MGRKLKYCHDNMLYVFESFKYLPGLYFNITIRIIINELSQLHRGKTLQQDYFHWHYYERTNPLLLYFKHFKYVFWLVT